MTEKFRRPWLLQIFSTQERTKRGPWSWWVWLQEMPSGWPCKGRKKFNEDKEGNWWDNSKSLASKSMFIFGNWHNLTTTLEMAVSESIYHLPWLWYMYEHHLQGIWNSGKARNQHNIHECLSHVSVWCSGLVGWKCRYGIHAACFLLVVEWQEW